MKSNTKKIRQFSDILIQALKENNDERSHKLILAGANINITNNLGWTQLQIATSQGELQFVKKSP